MPIQVLKGFFETRDQVLEDIRQTGFWPTTFVGGPSPELPLHWHDSEVHAYVLEGETWMKDGLTGERLAIGPGDKFIIPKGVLHAEGDSLATMVYIIGLPEPRTFKEFLRLQSPETAPTAAL